jgi:hypothetical protein
MGREIISLNQSLNEKAVSFTLFPEQNRDSISIRGTFYII